MAAVLGLERMYFGDDFGNDALERIVLVDKLLLLIAEVAARLGAFDHDGVGNVLIFCKPFLAQQFRGARRRYDGCQFGFGSFGKERRQVERQPGAREDDVRLLGDGGSDHVGEIGHGDHDIHADDAFRGLAGLFQFLFQPPDRGRTVIFRIVFVNHSQAGRRNDADAALVGDGRSQPCERYAYAHTALHDGDGSEQISDFQCFHVKLGLVQTK